MNVGVGVSVGETGEMEEVEEGTRGRRGGRVVGGRGRGHGCGRGRRCREAGRVIAPLNEICAGDGGLVAVAAAVDEVFAPLTLPEV